MIPAKNHEAVSKFVKVMPRILWPLFFQTVYMFTVQDRNIPETNLHFECEILFKVLDNHNEEW